ncbi:MAG: SurA N-terminal domain-containing protein, partial [Desulfobacterales bacterium]|nr:SurA N-terminal domain-containing protein [Desulfobacterales bacterium]
MTKRFESRKFFLAVLAACLIVWATAGEINAEGGQVVERIVAVVNDEVITLFDLNQTLAPYERQIQAMGYADDKQEQMRFKVREDMLNHLIDQKLTDQEIKRYKISVSDKEIDGTVEQIKNANHYTDESLRNILASQGMSYEEYREKIKEQILRSKLVNIEVRSRVVITPEETRAYYERHPELFQG